MRLFATIFIVLTGYSAFASGMASSNEDIIFSFSIVAFLIGLLGMVYLFELINKIRKDKDYRDHLQKRVVHLISTVRMIFIREKKVKEDEHLNYAVSLGV